LNRARNQFSHLGAFLADLPHDPDGAGAGPQEAGGTPEPDLGLVRIRRSKLYPVVARPGPAWSWTYEYAVDGGPWLQYGTGLTGLRRMLKGTHPGKTVSCEWEYLDAADGDGAR
jgi:hypothetical protein